MLGALTVRTACLETLNDKREGNWDDEVTNLLDSNYEDWRGPKGTYMVPREFSYRTRELDAGEQTEMEFFYLLQNFGESRSEPMFVIHSYKFAEMISEWNKGSNKKEKKWLNGEHDFVVIHRQCGIIFFQVKAAAKKGKYYPKAQEQIEKDKKALQAFIDENLSGKNKKAMDSEIYRYPGFVVMPNCPCPNGSVVKPAIGVFQEDCENVDAFSVWWNTKVAGVGRDTPFDQTLFEHLVMHFVGMSHSLPCTLNKLIDGNKKVMEMCTENQLSTYLNSVSEQWITGPAGSGKTWLLMKKVVMLAKDALNRETKEKILVVCYNRPLSVMFSKTFEDELINIPQDGTFNLPEVVSIKTFESLLHEITGSKSGNSDQEKAEHVAIALELLEKSTGCAQRYDHIFVDECQDLCGDEWPTLFKRLHKDDDDDEPKYIWFLYDTNQHLRLSEMQYQQHLKSINKKGTRLTKVYRSTRSVFEQSKKYFKVNNSNAKPITLGHHVHGLKIKWEGSLKCRDVTHDAGARSIKKNIENLRINKVDDKDICILTQDVGIRDGITSELEKMGIETQNAEDLFQAVSQGNKVVVESIRRFKGLESKVVILYNPPFYQNEDWTVKKVKELLYTAVSRCFCYLIVITTERGCIALQSEEGIVEQKNIHGKWKASSQSSMELESEDRFNNPFSRRGMETQYESGPPEPESPSKRCIEDDDADNDPDEIKRSPAKLLRMEEAEHIYKKSLKSKEKRQIKVSGCDLLEPGDPYIKDSIRNNVLKTLNGTVKQNLKYQPSSSGMDESLKNDVTSAVARIEYKVYDQRRGEINSRKYTQDCRDLKQEIEKFNNNQTCHKSVLEAIQESQATKDS